MNQFGWRDVNAKLFVPARPPKFHELRLAEIIEERLGEPTGRFLDIGCAQGFGMRLLAERFPGISLHGIDLNSELIELAKSSNEHLRMTFEVADSLTYQPAERFDALVASGILSIFDDPCRVLDIWLNWMVPGGTLFLFGRFNSADVDTKIQYKVPGGDWDGGFTSFSVRTVREHLDARGYKADFEKFLLPIDLPPPSRPTETFTINTVDGRRLVATGANILVEHHFLVVTAA